MADDSALYDRVAEAASSTVIRHYSSSFGLACRLLRPPTRQRIHNVYALVRLADEIVDGPMGVHEPARAGALLDRLEQDTAEAVREGYSSNLVVHAFATTARTCGIEPELVTPFFDSMRADLSVHDHDPLSFERYVYGSAEVVGLMCLRIFVADTPGLYDELAPGAQRLGAAFQKVNFLRDLADDFDDRGRCYFPGVDPATMTDVEKDRILDDIDGDLAAATLAAARLPADSRRAVVAAQALFTELAVRLRATPTSTIRHTRVRVPGPTKARIALTAMARDARGGHS